MESEGNIRQHHQSASLFVNELFGTGPFLPYPPEPCTVSRTLTLVALEKCALFVQKKRIVVVGECDW